MAATKPTTNPPVGNKNLGGPDSRVLRSGRMKKARYGLTPEELERRRAYGRAYYAANREKMKAYSKRYQKENPAYRAWPGFYDEKWAYNSQKARIATRIARGLPEPTRPPARLCECCGKYQKDRALSLDHCHVTGAFRGWLCMKCNTAIGKLGDNIEGVQKALDYLSRAIVESRP